MSTKVGALNDEPQLVRKRSDSLGAQRMPIFGLNVLPKSLYAS
jgi:hypothetical protein